MTLRNAFEGLSVESKQDAQIARLDALITELDGLEEAIGTTSDASSLSTVIGRLKKVAELLGATLSVSGTVALDSATLDALETVSASISGIVQVSQSGSWTVALDSASLAALESITATISGTVPVSAASLPLPTGAATEATLQSLLAELGDKLDSGGTVALDGATLAALENITATISGTVAISATELPLPSGAASEATAQEILTELSSKLEAGQAVALDAATLEALEEVTATISGTVAVSAQELPLPSGAATEAALQDILTELATKLGEGGTVALDAATLAALESITATISGTTAISAESLPLPTGAATNAALETLHDDLVALDVKVQALRDRNLAERMMAKAPADDYRLWLDMSDANHLYILEAPSSNAAGDVGFRGVRVSLDADGNPVGIVEENTGGSLTFSNRTTDENWS